VDSGQWTVTVAVSDLFSPVPVSKTFRNQQQLHIESAELSKYSQEMCRDLRGAS